MPLSRFTAFTTTSNFLLLQGGIIKTIQERVDKGWGREALLQDGIILKAIQERVDEGGGAGRLAPIDDMRELIMRR